MRVSILISVITCCYVQDKGFGNRLFPKTFSNHGIGDASEMRLMLTRC